MVNCTQNSFPGGDPTQFKEMGLEDKAYCLELGKTTKIAGLVGQKSYKAIVV